jgi:hypothetical protein
MSGNESKLADIEFEKFKLTTELTDQQGVLWFLLSLGIVIYFWAAGTPAVWNDELGRLVVLIIFIGILLIGVVSYTSKRSAILAQYMRLCSRLKDTISSTVGTSREATDSKQSTENGGKRQLEIWLAEYAAANSTRDHYDGTRWLIGSIFIAAIFTLFASSFLDQVARNNIASKLMAVISIVLWFVFVYYNHHVQPWVSAAIDRCHNIEGNLRHAGHDICLHASIKYETDKSGKVDFGRKRNQIGARWVIYFFSLMIPVIWILRLCLI